MAEALSLRHSELVRGESETIDHERRLTAVPVVREAAALRATKPGAVARAPVLRVPANRLGAPATVADDRSVSMLAP